MIDLNYSIIHSVIYSIILTTYSIIILIINPRIWLNHYPKKIRKAVPKRTKDERNLSYFLYLFYSIIFLWYPIFSNILYTGSINIKGVFIHIFIIFQFHNIVDLVFVDWLLFCTLTPIWIRLPENNDEKEYKNYFYHFLKFIVNVFVTTFISIILTIIIYFVYLH
jgi:hypothetical protein